MIDPVQIFKEEAAEHLHVLETALLELEEHPNDQAQISAAFRAMHTIKGAGGMVGYDHLSYFTHHLETFFDRVRDGRLALTSEKINLVLEARDHIATLLEDPEPSAELMVISETLLRHFRQSESGTAASSAPSQSAPSVAETADEQSCLYRIQIKPHRNAFKDGFDTLPVIRELRSLGPCHVSGYLSPDLLDESFEADTCYLAFTVLLSSQCERAALDDVFMFVQDDWDIQISTIGNDEACRVGDLLVKDGAISPEVLESIIQTQARTGELAQQQGLVDKEQVDRALAEQNYIRQQQKSKQPEEQSIRVPQRKLDSLMDQVGELVILQARVDQLALDLEHEQLASMAEELERLVTNLREITFDIRMLPIGSTFGRFRRLVRDLAQELGKEVELETQGEDTELDKVVLDKLVDPLVHILRNSLDHGIETPQKRIEQGKTGKGLLSLKASHYQGQILIEISDDGAGLDKDRIRSKAIEKGLIREDAQLDNQEIYALIFEPGFSTAAKISDVSGRGVGMDVVRSSIESLQGRVQLESEKGKGTRIRILLPMTLSIIEGLMVAVSNEKYVLPLNLVEECIETSASEISTKNGSRLIKHRNQMVPCLRLRECFSVTGVQPSLEQTVVVRSGDTQLGITVDEVIGNFQTVVRNLGRLYQDTPGVLGATILGDGGIAMILDVGQLAGANDSNKVQTT
ncbi:chemotaxis protein CheA [Aliiglaciecola sp. CAU 1673]|uniref:chemotaxis protein CheA n=1 Tax=Aliiglaciecola sp. CAU 1673 TaxID=3032595 RepID=UPI0023DB748C|nr:chemotaxis protein CheA [Aliiglaciecola sp. CAU 1673]MDF2178243.1 chemotaxis protein CheA [Aliiglaciecola sp. CAU 1673]